MLFSYLNQRAIFAKCIEIDNRGTPTYEEAKDMPCRKESYNKVIKTSTGEEKASTTRYFVADVVMPGDLIDDLVVLESVPWIGLNGKTLGYKVIV